MTTAAEIAALRTAVDRLAHTVGVGPDPRPPDGTWRDSDGTRLAEWVVVTGTNDETSTGRRLAVRAGVVDDAPLIFLVDDFGDMRPLTTHQGYQLVSALASALATFTDDLARKRRWRVSGEGKPTC